MGDGPNDAGMLALAGRSYCMADGMKTAKAAAKALALLCRNSMVLPSKAAVCGRRYSVEHQTTVLFHGAGVPHWLGAQAKSADLGSFPSPKAGHRVYYGHPGKNRFWPLMAA